jgi:CubicO group peptidase (beta-lactamase class C family)
VFVSTRIPIGGLEICAALAKEKGARMRVRTGFLAVTALLFMSNSFVLAQDVASNADQYVSTLAHQGRFSGVVLVAKGDKVLLRKGYGMANYEQNVPNTPEGVFRIGSITKSFTALSVLQLEEKGKLKVTDPASKYIPEMPKSWDAITIHQLLCHKSGIPDFVNAKVYGDLDDSQHIEKALKEYANTPLLSPPGETMRYSNAGYILLGRIIEKVSDQSYEDYLAENILRPAGMSHTAVDHLSPLVPNRANGYNFDGEFLINAKFGDSTWAAAAGALRSTIDDLYQFDRVLKSGKLFSSAVTAKAWTAYGHYVAPPPLPIEADYGYGWMTGEDFGHLYVGHGGWVNGFVSQFKRYPNDDAVLIILSNIETASYITVSQDLTAILFGQKYTIPVERKIVHPAQDVLARYVGNYQFGPITVKISMRNGRLYAFGTGQPAPFGMIATSDTEFYFNDTSSEVRFVVDDKGVVNQFMLKMGDKEMPVPRISQSQPGS